MCTILCQLAKLSLTPLGYANVAYHLTYVLQILLKTFLQNVASASATTRRTAASSTTVICLHARKPAVFFSWAINILLGEQLSVFMWMSFKLASKESTAIRISYSNMWTKVNSIMQSIFQWLISFCLFFFCLFVCLFASVFVGLFCVCMFAFFLYLSYSNCVCT